MMPCEECGKDAEYISSRWISDGALLVEYWCEEHKQEGAEKIDFYGMGRELH